MLAIANQNWQQALTYMGLEAGQKIATAGLQTLLDGQKVKLN